MINLFPAELTEGDQFISRGQIIARPPISTVNTHSQNTPFLSATLFRAGGEVFYVLVTVITRPTTTYRYSPCCL